MSTVAQAQALEWMVGGAHEMARKTGGRAFCRFTGESSSLLFSLTHTHTQYIVIFRYFWQPSFCFLYVTLIGWYGLFDLRVGVQIMKVQQTRRTVLDATERISLASSFLASLFLGRLILRSYCSYTSFLSHRRTECLWVPPRHSCFLYSIAPLNEADAASTKYVKLIACSVSKVFSLLRR